MRIWAIADLHLGTAVEKPMDVFGPQWANHAEVIGRNWKARVAPGDTVLVPGDISWGLRLAEARPDLELIGTWPGTKILVKGNHDLWWSSRSQVESVLPESLFILQNDARLLEGGVGVAGIRGWSLPGAPDHDEERDGKILNRELARLELGLKALEYASPDRRIVMMHFPPLWRGQLDTPFSCRLADARVDLCVYGHLHGEHRAVAFEGVHQGVTYRLVSCDHVGFKPVEVCG